MNNLREVIRPTLLISPSKMCSEFGIDITIATETFQHTGSFKFRAAYNLASSVPNDEILTASSGNFGQALAYACSLLGKKCTVVMPANSAAIKVASVRKFGGIADLVETTQTSRAERVEQLAAEMPNAYRASAYDDQYVIDGNSTLGEELAGRGFDAVLAPIGGGGLISGVVNGLRSRGDNAEIFGCEPLLANDAARSFRTGELFVNENEPQTIADGARTPSLGALNWPIIRDNVSDIIEVSDENIRLAVKEHFLLGNLKTEPTGALTLGAVIEQPERFRDRKICIVVSGGNVDPLIYSEIIK